mgnify:CR=1 FL=1
MLLNIDYILSQKIILINDLVKKKAVNRWKKNAFYMTIK